MGELRGIIRVPEFRPDIRLDIPKTISASLMDAKEVELSRPSMVRLVFQYDKRINESEAHYVFQGWE